MWIGATHGEPFRSAEVQAVCKHSAALAECAKGRLCSLHLKLLPSHLARLVYLRHRSTASAGYVLQAGAFSL